MSDDRKAELREVAKEKLPDPIIVIGYLEHQLDLIGMLLVDLAEGSTLSAEAQDRLDRLKTLLQYSSINFANITSVYESYKLPNAEVLKQETRKVQKQYLTAQIREGVFGE
jgi:hypothetical protein